MRDLHPAQTTWWHRMERRFVEVLERFGYGEIRTPLLESTELFQRSIGEETDIVGKEMYTFRDRDGESMTLRPEGTASAIRSYIENTQWLKEPVSRWYYLGPMFRHERPQKGRYRQFSQLGVELIGAAEPSADVEMIEVMFECMRAIELSGTTLEVNSLGCPVCRPTYREGLVTYLSAHHEQLCENCRRRLHTNPLRVMDCKEPLCTQVAAGAPHIIDSLCGDCATHFGKVRRGLDTLAIPYALNHRMVRGLDYYSRTTFELLAEGLGSQNAVAGGGRYDGLVKSLGGSDVPAVGFAAGLERILLRLQETLAAPEDRADVFVVTREEEGWIFSLPVIRQLRREGYGVQTDVRLGSLKAQMKRADKVGARLVLIFGEDEVREGAVTVKDMSRGHDDPEKQAKVKLAELEAAIVSKLGRPTPKV
jgi:histidyl-tRNA synthetase